MADIPWYVMTPEKQKLMQNQKVVGNVKYDSVPAPAALSPAPAATSPTPTAAVPSAPSVPKPQFTDSQLSAQSWINNTDSGQGGMDAYTARQNQRWQQANTTGDTDLINRLQADSQRVGYSLNDIPKPTAVPAPQSVSASSPSTPAPGTIDTARIQAEAKARIDKMIADKTRYANQTKAGLTSTYNKLRQTVGEDRALQDTANQRTLNPFSGRSDYALGMQNLQRARTDREQQDTFQTQMGNVDSQLNDFLQATPEQQQSMINELTRIERDYGLQVGALTGNFQGQRTLAGSAQDANYTGVYNGQRTMQAQNQDFQQQLAMAELFGQYNGQSTLAGKQANLNAALQVGDRMGKVLQPTQDWGGPLYNQQGTPNYQARQDAMKNDQWLQEYKRQTGNDAWQRQYQQGQLDNMWADNKRQNTNTNTNLLMDIWKATGKAPAGIPGVQQGTPYGQPSQIKSTDYKTDPNFAQDIAYLKGNKDAAQLLEANAQEFIGSYGYDGYLALRKAAGLDQ